MSTAVQDRVESRSNDSDNVYVTYPVHGNSKRECQIKRDGEACGARATLVSRVRDGRRRRSTPDAIYHCDHPRHIANAHKQITELLKRSN